MDLKIYYRNIRKTEALIAGDSVVVTSLETPDGGKPGILTEVPRYLAAKSIVESRARFATPDEVLLYKQGVIRVPDNFESTEARQSGKGRSWSAGGQ